MLQLIINDLIFREYRVNPCVDQPGYRPQAQLRQYSHLSGEEI